MSSLASPSPVSRLVAGRRSVASRLPRRAACPLAVRRANTTAADDAARPDADADADADAPPAGSIVVDLPAPEIVVVGLGPGDPGQITLEAWDVLTAPGARVFARTAQHPTLAGLPRDVAMSTFDHVYERTKNLQDVYPEIVEELVDAARCAAAAAEPDEDEDEDEDEEEEDQEDENASDASSSSSSSFASSSSSSPSDDTFASYVLPADADEVRVRREPRARRVVYAVPGDPCVAERSVALLRRRCEDAGVALTLVHGVSFLEPTLAAVGADVMPALAIVDAIDVARARAGTPSAWASTRPRSSVSSTRRRSRATASSRS
jgi:precorrin-2 methylase